ncbi:hypothetical protein [Chitinophaga sp. S165]|nr:hypothetical protein [Chitinophaga sp. S165]PWV48160.1 hypothetical protein C7475_10766 [Chitinophaga sp. S165]
MWLEFSTFKVFASKRGRISIVNRPPGVLLGRRWDVEPGGLHVG